MISTDTYFLPVWIAIFVQSVTSLPEKAAHLSPWNWDDDDWFRPRSTTRSPYIWDRITYSPPDPYDKPRSTGLRAEPIVWIIVGLVIILSILAALLRYFCAHMDHGTDINRTGRVLHPPPVIIVPTPERTTLPQHSRNSTTVTLGGGLYDHPLTVPTYGVGDKPPGYSDVMMTDFGEEKLFPEVAQRLPDTPPPKYEDGNLPKY